MLDARSTYGHVTKLIIFQSHAAEHYFTWRRVAGLCFHIIRRMLHEAIPFGLAPQKLACVFENFRGESFGQSQ